MNDIAAPLSKNSVRPETSSKADKSPFWARIETLWLFIPTLIAAIYALLQPLAPNDLWYHVRAGQIIAHTGAIPTQNLMSHGAPLDAPYFYQSWLSEWLLFQTLHLGGLSGLQILRAFCLAFAFGCVTLAAFRFLRRENIPALIAARLASLGAIWGFLIASNNVDLRPQTFSVVLCGAWILVLLEFHSSPEKRKIFTVLLLVLATLWANFHGAFVVGLVTVFAFALAAIFARRDAKPYLILLAGCVLATFLNPSGAWLYVYLARLSNDPIGQKYIQEWASPALSDWHSWLFYASLPLLLWGYARGKWHQKPISAPVFAALLLWIMGARDQRSMIWLALAFTPIFAYLLAPKSATTVVNPIPIPRAAKIINAVLLIFLLALPIPFLPSIKPNLPWPDEFRARFAPTPTRVFRGDPPLLLERSTPVEALEWLAKRRSINSAREWSGRRDVFTDMVPGSFLTFAGQGVVVPLCDPRIELFGVPFWEEYVRLSGGPEDAPQTLKQRGFRFALLDEEAQNGLLKVLQGAGWKRVAGGGKTHLLQAP